jgi:hypothetical protein
MAMGMQGTPPNPYNEALEQISGRPAPAGYGEYQPYEQTDNGARTVGYGSNVSGRGYSMARRRPNSINPGSSAITPMSKMIGNRYFG